MTYTIYEDPTTHRWAHLPLPGGFRDGDQLPAVVGDRWFESHDAAIAALAELLTRDEGEPAAVADVPVPVQAESAPPQPTEPPPRPVVWPHH
jgi:hypothetical protein